MTFWGEVLYLSPFCRLLERKENVMYTSDDPKHSIYAEMRRVHNSMIAKYNLDRSAASDIARAKTMTKYLRAFKAAGNRASQGDSPIQTSFETEAMAEIAAKVGKALGIKKYSLFRNQHFWYGNDKGDRSAKSLWGADDVFEAELATFLNTALTKAVGRVPKGQKAALVGDLPSNISEGFMQELAPYFEKKTNAETHESDLISKPQFRAGKVDVTSFSGEISARVNPMWDEFIAAFAGARFTVKNYSGNSQNEVIHLGNTNIAKSLLGSLSEMGFQEKEALHIFYHSLAYAQKGNSFVGEHILHLRFAYELAGGGLRDSSGKRLDSADFFVYNDPTSDNIYVRSTKAMIADAMKYMRGVRDPLRSNIVILKSSF